MPREMTCYVLDYHMAFGNKQAYRDAIKKVAARRPLVIIEWAHHDDGGYLGRPYAPPVDFATKLKDTGAAGYGVIHWTTRPLDIFQEKAIRKYVEKASHDGGMTRGEKGILIQHNLKWLKIYADAPAGEHQSNSIHSFPAVKNLPDNVMMPDPFSKSDGIRVTSMTEWKRHRSYLRAMMEYYLYGRVPPKPTDKELSFKRVSDEVWITPDGGIEGRLQCDDRRLFALFEKQLLN